MAKVHKNSLLRVRKDLHVDGLITYAGPLVRKVEGTLPAGEILRLEYEPAETVDGVWLVPERYGELEKHFVSKEIQAERGYRGFVLCCSLKTLPDCYDLISPSEKGN